MNISDSDTGMVLRNMSSFSHIGVPVMYSYGKPLTKRMEIEEQNWESMAFGFLRQDS